MIQILESPSGAARLRAAADFLAAIPPGDEVLIVGASRGAVDDLVRTISVQRAATFGLHRFTLTQLAARLAAPALADDGLATCTRLASELVATRATFAALERDRIPYFTPVARCPGFGRSLAASLADLRGAAVEAHQLSGPAPAVAQLGTLLAAYGGALADAQLADRATMLSAAIGAVQQPGRDPLLGLPLLLLDLTIETHRERELVAALCASAARGLATLPTGDARTRAALTSLGSIEQLAPDLPAHASSLAHLQTYLFAGETPSAGAPDDAVRFFSAPGEGRETVEIARWILAEARTGTPFDHIVVFLRSPETYSALLETAFRRAGVPAYFARGVRRPNPSGRAFFALLACASDQLSAKRFADYLSFGQVPELAADGAPPAPRAVWTGPRDDALGAAVAAAVQASEPASDTEDDLRRARGERRDSVTGAEAGPTSADASPTRAGALRAPWRWEALLTDAAVIGGAQRWARRLAGLARELELERDELGDEEPESARRRAVARELADLDHLRRFAVPVVEQLAAFPGAATWGEWLSHLTALAPRVLRQPEPVLQALAELAPLAAVGPVGLDEVSTVLSERLSFLTDDPPKYREGRVLVATLDEARGRSFQVVFVPGLAERVFPQRPREDPLLLDGLRIRLSADLPTQDDRIDRERLLLRLAVGAAARRVYLSYPRVDVAQGRPRVTSFYGLDVARATRGEMPDVEAFERQADSLVGARLAWPAPPEARHAIDVAEHDLAVLAELMRAPADSRLKGGAQYLLELNEHLARSLRTRYKRWDPEHKWSRFDGFVHVGDATRDVLAAYRLTARPYSPSALQHFAACPYRFFLAAIQRLAPRREAAPLEQLDPLTRGKLIHRVQAETLRALADAGALPVTAERLADAERVLGATLDAVATRLHDDLAPPILRVWQDEIAALRGDLVYWLRHLAERAGTWHPAHFEFGFGLAPDATRDPHSRPEPMELPGGLLLHGSVDLIERRADGRALRVTDHKTGLDRTRDGMVVGAGEVLQPVLYGLAVEGALRTPVEDARLFFCTARGGFGERIVALDERARAQGVQVLEIIDRAIARGFLPPAPREDACARCDFHVVCGPHEEERVRRKEAQPLAELIALRQRP